jgi:hypothetical protein
VEKLNLSTLNYMMHGLAQEAFNDRDVLGFVGLAGSGDALALIYDNVFALKHRGIYEAALVRAFTGTRVNHSDWPDSRITFLFQQAEKKKMREAGGTIPDAAVKIYRGISGHGRRRRLKGYSWTDSLKVACWFAIRWELPNPAVLTATVQPDEILCCVNDRQEREFIVCPSAATRLKMSLAEMKQHAARKTGQTG